MKQRGAEEGRSNDTVIWKYKQLPQAQRSFIEKSY
jgi:hypothetical protein